MAVCVYAASLQVGGCKSKKDTQKKATTGSDQVITFGDVPDQSSVSHDASTSAHAETGKV